MEDDLARGMRARNAPLPEPLVDPHPDRLPTDHPASRAVRIAHRRAITDGADGYVDPVTGMFAFTALYHWAKGACCELGCRHCPWLDADARIAAAGPT